MRALLFGACSAAALVAGTAHAPAHAQVTEVVILGYLEEEIPQQLARYGTRVETVTAQEILDGGYYDVTETLEKQVPGMFIAARGGVFDYVNVSYQGSRTSDVLWLVDGVRINNRLYASTTPVDTIPAHMLDRLEALEGGQGLFYGTQGIAGAVNMVTRGFSEMSDGMVKVGLDTNEGYHASGYYRDTLGAHQFVVYASHDEAEGFQPFRDQDYQPSSTDRKRSYEVTTYGGKYGIDLSEALRFSATYQHTDAQLDHAFPKFAAIAYNTRDEDIVTGRIDYSPTDNFELFVKGYYHWWDAAYTEFDNTIPPGGPLDPLDIDTPWAFDDYGINILARYDTGSGVEFFGGYDFQGYQGFDDVLEIGDQTAKTHAPFAQIRTTDDLFPNARLAFGVRHNMPTDGEDATIWNLSGHWDVFENLFVRGNVGTSFRLPTLEELYAEDPCCTFGNANLEPEKGLGVNASIGGEFPVFKNVNWEMVGFWREIENQIGSETVVPSDPTEDPFEQYFNVPGSVDTRGIQIVLNANITPDLSADGSYTFARATATGSGDQINDIPESFAKFGLDYHPTNSWFGLNLDLLWVGDIYRDLGGAFGRVNYGDYTVVDIGGRVYLDQDRRHRIGINLQNVFDEEYATRIRTTTPDAGGPAYIYWHLGTPRTLRVDYSFQFSLM